MRILTLTLVAVTLLAVSAVPGASAAEPPVAVDETPMQSFCEALPLTSGQEALCNLFFAQEAGIDWTTIMLHCQSIGHSVYFNQTADTITYKCNPPKP